MNIYCVYSGSSKNESEEVIVKQGFSFYAAIFCFFWALYHKMWGIAALYVALVLLLTDPLKQLGVYYLFNIAILFVFGFFAGDLREYYLFKKGLKLYDIIIAFSEEEAELKYNVRKHAN